MRFVFFICVTASKRLHNKRYLSHNFLFFKNIIISNLGIYELLIRIPLKNNDYKNNIVWM